MIVTIVMLAALFALIYYYLTKSFGYWTNLGVPGPKPSILVGNFPSTLTQKRHAAYEIDDIYREYRQKGHQYVGVFSFNAPQLVAIDGDSVKEILIRSFTHFHDNEFADYIDKKTDPIFGRNPFMLQGEEWKEKRNEITPAFTANRIKAMKPLVDDVSAKMVKYISSEIDKKPVNGFDSKELCTKFTTDVVSSCIFALDAKSFSDSQNEAIIRQMGTEIMSFTTSISFLIYTTLAAIFPALKKLYNMPLVPKNVTEFFSIIMKDAVKYRADNSVQRQDYLDHLIQLKKKKNISDMEMAAHGVTFFIDGFETSSNVMAYMLYCLAANPDCQTRLRDEINANVDADGSMTYETVNEIPYLEQVFNETLRIYPPVSAIVKKCTSPLHLNGDNGSTFKVETGTGVIIPITSVHWDAANYPDPMKFDPERFSAEKGGAKVYEEAGVYIGFGLGPRTCLGKRFAKAQVKMGIVEIIKNFELSVNARTQEPIILDPKNLFTQAIGGLWVDFKNVSAGHTAYH